MSCGIWDILGVAPTHDAAEIRRAYAAALKRTRPDEDPEGFVRLRAAYEAALRNADRHQAALQAPAVTAQPEQLAAPGEPSIDQRVVKSIHQGDVGAAAALLLEARGENTLPLGIWMRLSDLLATRMARDPAITEHDVQRIARDFGWYGAGAQPPTPAAKAVRIRIDAAEWLVRLRAEAAKLTRFIGNDRAAASALLLGKGRLGAAGLLPPYTEVHALLSALHGSGEWAQRALDADRIVRLQTIVRDQSAQHRRRVAAIILVVAAFAAAGEPRAAFLGVLAMARMRPALLRRSTLIALVLAGATAIATESGDERARLATFYTTIAVCGGYFCIAIFGFARKLRDPNWRETGKRAVFGVLGLGLTAMFVGYGWETYKPFLQPYGVGNFWAPPLISAVTLLIVFVIRRGGGGGPDAMPRW